MTRGGALPDRSILEHMAGSLAHRGPDGEGIYVAKDVGLVHRRLAIIDLETGAQPLHAAGEAVLVANAEIYNYVELRRSIGGPFATASDCEPILSLLRQHDLDFVRHLRGMYALAMHDPSEDRLILSRDPFGIKPLYYTQSSSAFAFASEPQALVQAGLVGRDIDKREEATLLQLQYTIGPQTLFRDVRRVLPGETIVVRAGRVVERRRLPALPPADAPSPFGTDEEALLKLDSVLDDTVKVHRRSDVPYGVFLSGGIDSAAILTMISRQSDQRPCALTVGFSEGKVPDERSWARDVAQRCGAETIETEFSETDFWSLLPAVACALDDPCADYAILPTFKLAQLARDAGIKVILSGEGGDEMFAGYGRYRSAIRPLWRGGRAMRMRGVFDGFGLSGSAIDDWRDGLAAQEQCESAAGRNALQTAQAVDCADWLPNDLLLKLDRCLMACGVEGRTPFLDRAVADFALPLPDGMKVRRGRGKWILRQWVSKQLPGYRAFDKKRGFTVPVAEWIWRHGARLGPLVAAHPGIRLHLDAATVHSLFATHSKRAGRAAWVLVFYALWHNCHVLGGPSDGDVFDVLSEARVAA